MSKCVAFDIKKSSTAAVQFEPHLMISGQKIATVKIGESFKYLGKSFSFEKDLHHIKVDLKINLKSTFIKLMTSTETTS